MHRMDLYALHGPVCITWTCMHHMDLYASHGPVCIACLVAGGASSAGVTFPLNLCNCSWWSIKSDLGLLYGTWKHGYANYDEVGLGTCAPTRLHMCTCPSDQDTCAIIVHVNQML